MDLNLFDILSIGENNGTDCIYLYIDYIWVSFVVLSLKCKECAAYTEGDADFFGRFSNIVDEIEQD